MSSLYLISSVGPREDSGARPAAFIAAEAFDDEPFSMNITVDEAAAAGACEAVVAREQRARAS